MTRGGSTTAWRKLRLYVAARDGMTCRRPGCECGNEPLTMDRGKPNSMTLGHVLAVDNGGTNHPENLRAECARWNYSEGAAISNGKRARSRLNTSRDW